jgi:anti-sigma-K factor RskA
MDKRIKEFLESGQLESYILGSLSDEENDKIAKMIVDHPEVDKEYIKIQEELESMAMKNAVPPPVELKSKIIEEVKSIPQTVQPNSSSFWKIGAVILGIGLITSGLFARKFFTQKQQIQTNYADLLENCQKNDQFIASLLDENMNKTMIKGNTLIPDFQISFFYDKNQEIVHYSTPTIDLPSDKCLQLWGDIEGEMIPLGVLNQTVAGSFTIVKWKVSM